MEIESTSENTNKNWSLYRHVSPSGKVYIGITGRSLHQRWCRDGTGYRGCRIFEKAIKKYGWDNIKHEVLFTKLTKDRAILLEKVFIAYYKRHDLSYNIADGGEGSSGHFWTNEMKKAQSNRRKGTKMSPLAKQHHAEAMAKRRGIPVSKQTKHKLHEANKGKKPSPLTIAALKEYNRTHPVSEETKKKLSITRKNMDHTKWIEILNKNRTQIGIKHRKPVVQISLDGNVVQTFDSGKEASRLTNIDPSTIAACCNGRQFKAGGYLWMHATKYFKYLNNGTLQENLDYLIAHATKNPKL